MNVLHPTIYQFIKENIVFEKTIYEKCRFTCGDIAIVFECDSYSIDGIYSYGFSLKYINEYGQQNEEPYAFSDMILSLSKAFEYESFKEYQTEEDINELYKSFNIDISLTDLQEELLIYMIFYIILSFGYYKYIQIDEEYNLLGDIPTDNTLFEQVIFSIFNDESFINKYIDGLRLNGYYVQS